jgi:hypothetical protein
VYKKIYKKLKDKNKRQHIAYKEVMVNQHKNTQKKQEVERL